MSAHQPPAPATGKLGILTPGMGAVSTTFVAGAGRMRTSCVAGATMTPSSLPRSSSMGGIFANAFFDNRTAEHAGHPIGGQQPAEASWRVRE